MKILRLFICIFLAFCVVFSYTFGLGKINYAEKEIASKQEYKCIITLWHIDSFEGGIGSRAEFLLGRAGEFEKKNPGVLIMVVNHTVESALERLKNGDNPDMISYGYGLELDNLSPIEKQHFPFSEYDGKTYAVPWCMGGYVVLSRTEITDGVIQKAVISKGSKTLPFIALTLSGISVKEYKIKEPIDAYYDFISGSTDCLVGTQRDVNRVLSRGENYYVTPLQGYNDLYQYMSITCTNSEKKYYVCAYLDYLLSKTSQEKLNKIGMLSYYYDVPNLPEQIKKVKTDGNAYGFSLFTPQALWSELNDISYVVGEKQTEEIKKIKNIVYKP